MHISHLILHYVDGRERRGEIVALTAASIRSNLTCFARTIGDPPVADLNRSHIEQWAESVDLAPSTRRTRISQIRNFCAWAVEHGWLDRDPSIGIRGPRQPRLVPRGLVGEDVAAVFAHAPDARAELILSLMFQEGLRRVEVARLTVGDLNLAERVMLVIGKGSHERVLPITDETHHTLVRYLAEHPATAGPLIRSYADGRSAVSPATIGRLVSAAMLAARVKTRAYDGRSAHAARHTAATDMVKGGAHLRDVQRALGHQSLATTERYLSWLVGDLREAMGGRSYRASTALAT